MGLNSVVAPTVLGFALINGFTFGVDLLLLTALHGWRSAARADRSDTGLRLRVHAELLTKPHHELSVARAGRTTVHGLVAVVVTVNYLAFILGVSSALTALGVDFRIARILAGCCEAMYMYCAMRWVVFRR